jgi:YbbR domain-containing protein
MSWITTDWRLKLLAVGLAAVLLFVVGYSQYPIQIASVDAKVNYDNAMPVGLEVNNPPVTSKVAISGLASDIRLATVTVDVDLSKLKEGTGVVVSPSAQVTGSQGVRVVSVSPITLKVEQLATVNLDIQIHASFANGWQLTKAQAECGQPTATCQVTVSGPTSVMQGLGAYVVVDETIAVPEKNVPGSIIKFNRNGTDVDLTKILAFPAITWTPTAVQAHVFATHGTVTVQVALVNALPTALPPAGYHVTAVIVSPLLITITGSPETLAGITSITLPAVSLAGLTSDKTFTLKIVAPDPSIQLSVKNATVTYKIAPDPTVSPSP